MLRTVLVGIGCMCGLWAGASPVEGARGLLERLLPQHASAFELEHIPQQDGRDVFELESVGDKVVLRGSSGVGLASALNWYLKHYAHASASLCGNQLALPDPLPRVPEKLRIVTPFKHRYCFNYCCFSYSMAWWDWPQWERAIDWLALHGVNMPLAVTGQEATWQAVCRALGLSDEEIGAFMVGPAYLPFSWMGCMDGWGGPLPQSWIDRHRALQQKILARERELGMTPVLQGFTGHVPAALKDKFPDAKFQQLPSWCGFPGTLFVDPQDALFLRIGQAFIEEQTRMYGTDHLYASDTFIEMSPPSKDPAFLAAMGKAVYDAMKAGDPEATWVMQGWLFVNNPKFWQPPQAKALLGAVPDDRMVVLDLFCEQRPAWQKTEAFYGKPWVWCIIQSFGNQVSLHGALPRIAQDVPAALASPDRGNLRGMGFIMEGLGYNPVVYDLMTDLMWRPEPRDLEAWIRAYAHRRYGRALPKAEQAWLRLLGTAYQVPGQVGSIICGRPALGPAAPHVRGGCPYSALELARAWDLLLACADDLGGIDTYQYDLVHVTRQVLCNLAPALQSEVSVAYKSKDRQGLVEARARFVGLMRDLDELLATREEFLLGRWLADAAHWATNEDERRLYAWNARNQITLWGPRESILHDYANKQWAGLIAGFYIPRWEQFLDRLDRSLVEEKPFDAAAFRQDIQTWEEAWTHSAEACPDQPQGDAVGVARRIAAKYRERVFRVEAPSLTTGKPVSCSYALPPYPAHLANDGQRSNVDSYWATDVNRDKACWWQVDLEAPTQVGRVVAILYYGDERDYGFFVETSLDAETWDLVADYREDLQRSTRDGITCRFTPRQVRFIRVTVTHNSANTGRHLVEVMAYAE